MFSKGEKIEKLKIYLDTSVISLLEQKEFSERMKQSQKLVEILKKGKYNAFISEFAKGELMQCSTEKSQKLLSSLEEIEYTMVKTTRL